MHHIYVSRGLAWIERRPRRLQLWTCPSSNGSTGFLEGTITNSFRFGVTKVESAFTERGPATGAASVLDITQGTGTSVTIHEIVCSRQAGNALHILGRVINLRNRIAIGNDIECVLVKIFNCHWWIQRLAGDNGIRAGQTNGRSLGLGSSDHGQTSLQKRGKRQQSEKMTRRKQGVREVQHIIHSLPQSL